MHKSDPKTRARQNEIKKIVNVISTLEIEDISDRMEIFLKDLGHASISDSTLNCSSPDFLYLDNLFC